MNRTVKGQVIFVIRRAGEVVSSGWLVVVVGVVGNEGHGLVAHCHIYQAIRRVVLHLVVQRGDAILERGHLLAKSRRNRSGADELGQALGHLDQLVHHLVLRLPKSLRESHHRVPRVVDEVDHSPGSFPSQQDQ